MVIVGSAGQRAIGWVHQGILNLDGVGKLQEELRAYSHRHSIENDRFELSIRYMDIMSRDEFRALLLNIWHQSGSDFSGIGIIICNNPFQLPIINLREDSPDKSGSTAEVLSALSRVNSKYHDGFHILDESGCITHVAQYFSPPIIQKTELDRSRPIGGRFVASLYGSAIEGVLMTGIVSAGHGLSIFEKGKETHFEVLK